MARLDNSQLVRSTLNILHHLQNDHSYVCNRKLGQLVCSIIIAPGIDGIPSEVLKCFNEPVCRALTAIYNRIIESGIFPNLWAQGLIVPIYKARS